MKKFTALLLAVMMLLSLGACSKKEKTPDYYGRYATTELHDTTGAYSDDVLAIVLEDMRAKNQLFEIELGEESKMYNPTGESGFSEIVMNVDMENKIIVNATNESDRISFDFVDGKLVIVDQSSGIQFVMEKSTET